MSAICRAPVYKSDLRVPENHHKNMVPVLEKEEKTRLFVCGVVLVNRNKVSTLVSSVVLSTSSLLVSSVVLSTSSSLVSSVVLGLS